MSKAMFPSDTIALKDVSTGHNSAGNGGDGTNKGDISSKPTFIYDASMAYQADGTKLIIIGGEDYGMGSSRDWAAKGTRLLGVSVVVTKSFERIHRSNLIGMGVLPLCFEEGTSWQSLGLKGDEQVTIRGLHGELKPRQRLMAEIVASDGGLKRIPLISRIDTLDEVEYFKNGGILQYVLRQLAA